MSVTFAPLTGEHDDRPELNVASANARVLLDLLGLLPSEDSDDCYDLYGEMDPHDFEGRILIAQALLDASSDDAHGTPDIVEGNWITFGRRPGYLADRLEYLHKVVAWAIAHGGNVVWS